MTAFAPGSGTVTLAVTASSVNASIVRGYPVLLLSNAGPNVCFVQLGVGAQVATVGGFPVLVGQAVAMNPGGSNNVAAICAAAGTASLYVTGGTGNVTGGD